MKYIKNFENLYSKEDEKQFKVSSENIELISKRQKEKGGVISLSATKTDAIKEFEELGYTIKYIKPSDVNNNKEILNDIRYRNHVDYIICYLPEDDDIEILGE